MKLLISVLCLLSSVLFCSAQVSTPRLIPDRVFYVSDYGATPTAGFNNKQAFTDCHAAAVAAGGGIMKVGVGTFEFSPLSTQLAILLDSEYVILEGSGPGTILKAITATAGNGAPFCLIAPSRYDTCTAPYTAAPLWIRNLRLTADAYTGGQSDECHDLVGIAHCPWFILEDVGFEQGLNHAFEINCSKNGQVLRCYTYGTGNFANAIAELDGLGNCGKIATGGTHSASTPNENILISGFQQRAGRTDLTISPATAEFLILSHTNTNNIVRSFRLENSRIIAHTNSSLSSGSTSNVVAFDSGALPLEFSGSFHGNTFTGGLTGSTVCYYLASESTSTRKIRVSVTDNHFDCGALTYVQTGETFTVSDPQTNRTINDCISHQSIVVNGNRITNRLTTNLVAGVRPTWAMLLGPCANLELRQNVQIWPDQTPFAAGTDTSNFGYHISHALNLVCSGNTFEMGMLSATKTWPAAGFVFNCGSFELSGIAQPANWIVTNNLARGVGSVGGNLAVPFVELLATGTSGMPQWVREENPYVSGQWSGNYGVTGGTFAQTINGSTAADFPVPMNSILNVSSAVSSATAAAVGAHDWRAFAGNIGSYAQFPASAQAGPGWTSLAGTAVSSLGWHEQANWNIRLAKSGSANLPTVTDTYVRLSGK